MKGNCFSILCWFLPSSIWITSRYSINPSLLNLPPTIPWMNFLVNSVYKAKVDRTGRRQMNIQPALSGRDYNQQPSGWISTLQRVAPWLATDQRLCAYHDCPVNPRMQTRLWEKGSKGRNLELLTLNLNYWVNPKMRLLELTRLSFQLPHKIRNWNTDYLELQKRVESLFFA